MQKLSISTAQFEHKSGDKKHNLGVIEVFANRAAVTGSSAIAFHECCLSGYTFARHLSKGEMLELAESVPGGESIKALQAIARKTKITILAGLFEKDKKDNLFNTYVCVDENGLVARHRKLHPFISSFLSPGEGYTVFELCGWKCGILTCYDNNIIENVRATTLLGARVIFMPHVTMCTPSSRPGAGFVNPELWANREQDPASLRLEFDSMKGRAWLMKWLPARAFDNGVYVVFSNVIGMDDNQLKNGCSMIVDPFGDILAECRTLGDDFVTAMMVESKLRDAGGYRYLAARRPELYRDILGKEHRSEQKVSWISKNM